MPLSNIRIFRRSSFWSPAGIFRLNFKRIYPQNLKWNKYNKRWILSWYEGSDSRYWWFQIRLYHLHCEILYIHMSLAKFQQPSTVFNGPTQPAWCWASINQRQLCIQLLLIVSIWFHNQTLRISRVVWDSWISVAFDFVWLWRLRTVEKLPSALLAGLAEDT